jgi:hypothetical protein
MSSFDIALVYAPFTVLFVLMLIGFGVAHYLEVR